MSRWHPSGPMSRWPGRPEPNRRVPAWRRDPARQLRRRRRWLARHDVYRPSALGLLLRWLRVLLRR